MINKLYFKYEIILELNQKIVNILIIATSIFLIFINVLALYKSLKYKQNGKINLDVYLKYLNITFIIPFILLIFLIFINISEQNAIKNMINYNIANYNNLIEYIEDDKNPTNIEKNIFKETVRDYAIIKQRDDILKAYNKYKNSSNILGLKSELIQLEQDYKKN